MIDVRSSDVNIPFWRKKRGFLWRMYLYYISKKTPIQIEKVDYLGEESEKIILPFTREDIVGLSREYLQKYMSKVIEKTQLEKCYVSNSFSKYFEVIFKEYFLSYQSILLYIMFKDILINICGEMSIEEKDLKILIIDSEDRRTEYMIESIVDDINYLTIITKRPEYFQGYIDMIYDTKGLVIQLEEDITKSELEGNVVIDLSKESYRHLRGALAILDMNQTEKKLKYYYSRRKNNNIIYNVLLESDGEVVDNPKLEFLLIRNHQVIRDFIRDRSRENYVVELQKLKEMLGLNIEQVVRL